MTRESLDNICVEPSQTNGLVLRQLKLTTVTGVYNMLLHKKTGCETTLHIPFGPLKQLRELSFFTGRGGASVCDGRSPIFSGPPHCIQSPPKESIHLQQSQVLKTKGGYSTQLGKSVYFLLGETVREKILEHWKKKWSPLWPPQKILVSPPTNRRPPSR